jgi:hypothetical protein
MLLQGAACPDLQFLNALAGLAVSCVAKKFNVRLCPAVSKLPRASLAMPAFGLWVFVHAPAQTTGGCLPDLQCASHPSRHARRHDLHVFVTLEG